MPGSMTIVKYFSYYSFFKHKSVDWSVHGRIDVHSQVRGLHFKSAEKVCGGRGAMKLVRYFELLFIF